MLEQSSETLAEKDNEYVDPIHLPQIHDVGVCTVDFVRGADVSILPTIILSAGYDGKLQATDTRNIFAPIEFKGILSVPHAVLGVPWAEGFVFLEGDGGARLEQMYFESSSFRIFCVDGVIWDLSYSDYQPYITTGVSDGKLLMTNVAFRPTRGY
ncbi:hypothetical protein BGZ94_006294, partial [Podila epigama]